ncbi:MAG: hypothetical protein F6K40_32785 [Okeania sp. SIO3I5]|uniref:hypothetical protein n=1 Tax=Okeania sp. SIO3I5 TaxID=2607805 RepID=UPI0013BBF419|nr:hypothetical protein [Okeania sp. SIO3I5]NEQ40743.1 hypothetical protein [Okeania sp. SIO3I5]
MWGAWGVWEGVGGVGSVGRSNLVRTYAESPYLVGANGIHPLQIAYYLGVCVISCSDN